jgi:hypothetical protein
LSSFAAVHSAVAAVSVHGGAAAMGSTEVDAQRHRAVFAEADSSRSQCLTLEDFGRLLVQRVRVGFNDATVAEMFNLHSGNGRFLTFAEFQVWARTYPGLFAAVERRLQQDAAEADALSEMSEAARAAAAVRAEMVELQTRLDALRADVDHRERRERELGEAVEAARRRRAHVEEEEQPVLEKEALVQFRREALRREEGELREAARRLEERTAQLR